MTHPAPVAALALLFLSGVLCAQEQKCSLAGKVTNAATGEPLKKTEVVLRRADSRSEAPYGAITDAAGQFAIRNVEPGTYRLMADRSGFVHGEYGAHAPGRRGAVLVLDAGREMTDLSIRLTPQAVITGRVLDEDGDPVASANVQAMRYSRVHGRRQLMPSTGTMTNDLGEFRLHSLAPGEYYISALYRPGMRWRAVQSGGSSAGYAPIYYPNALNPSSATPLNVSAGAILPGIEIQLSRVAMVRVSGRVWNSASDSPARRATVMLRPQDSIYAPGHNVTSVRGANGAFELSNVVPGSYLITAMAFENGTRYMVRQTLDVGDGGIEGVDLSLSAGMELPGRVRLENQPEATLAGLRVMLQPDGEELAAAGPPAARVNEDGSFLLKGVMPDVYQLAISGIPGNGYVRVVRVGQQELPQSRIDLSRGAAGALDVVLDAGGGEVAGLVNGDDRQPAAGVIVVLVPDAGRRDQWSLFRSTSTDQYGRFQLGGIPPGNYKVFAWEEVDNDAFLDPEFLKPFEGRGKSVSLHANSREGVELQVIAAGDEAPSQ